MCVLFSRQVSARYVSELVLDVDARVSLSEIFLYAVYGFPGKFCPYALKTIF